MQLDKLLSSTRLLSAPENPDAPGLAEQNLQGAHDEHLFIIMHQTYELGFKQILWELDSVVALFDAAYVPEASVGLATGRLHRISETMRILVDQLTVLETMSPMQFLDFRDHLFPASGFQSMQWRARLIRMLIWIPTLRVSDYMHRLMNSRPPYHICMRPPHNPRSPLQATH